MDDLKPLKLTTFPPIFRGGGGSLTNSLHLQTGGERGSGNRNALEFGFVILFLRSCKGTLLSRLAAAKLQTRQRMMQTEIVQTDDITVTR
jgi:hypothetical protein